MMFGLGDPVARGREKAARSARGALAEYYSRPVPVATTPVADLTLLAVDIEATGLDTARDQILAIGYVPVDGSEIVLSGARNMVVAGASVGQSATIHRLTDDVIAAGVPRADALAETLHALAGRVLLAHHARLEIDFLSRACVELFGAPLVTPVVDTMVLQQRIIAPGFDDEPRADDLRLWTARARFHLPRYSAHEALTDALACAELYLAQLTELSASTSLRALSS